MGPGGGKQDETADEEAFDLVSTLDPVHKQPRPSALLMGIARTLRSDGVYLVQDFHASTDVRGTMDHPMRPSRWAWTMGVEGPPTLFRPGQATGWRWLEGTHE